MAGWKRPSSAEALRRIALHSLRLRDAMEERPPEQRLTGEQLRDVARRRERAGELSNDGHFVRPPEV